MIQSLRKMEKPATCFIAGLSGHGVGEYSL